jgi:hypothetical protein
MILLTSLAALSLGAAPVQAQNNVQARTPVEPVKAEVATPAAPVERAASVTVWKAKPKPWLKPDMVKPAAKWSALARL